MNIEMQAYHFNWFSPLLCVLSVKIRECYLQARDLEHEQINSVSSSANPCDSITCFLGLLKNITKLKAPQINLTRYFVFWISELQSACDEICFYENQKVPEQTNSVL